MDESGSRAATQHPGALDDPASFHQWVDPRLGMELWGWVHCEDGRFWPLPSGHEPRENVDSYWVPVYAEHYEVRNV